MSEACRSASLKRTSPIVVKIYSFKHKNMTKIPSAPVKLLYHYGGWMASKLVLREEQRPIGAEGGGGGGGGGGG